MASPSYSSSSSASAASSSFSSYFLLKTSSMTRICPICRFMWLQRSLAWEMPLSTAVYSASASISGFQSNPLIWQTPILRMESTSSPILSVLFTCIVASCLTENPQVKRKLPLKIGSRRTVWQIGLILCLPTSMIVSHSVPPFLVQQAIDTSLIFLAVILTFYNAFLSELSFYKMVRAISMKSSACSAYCWMQNVRMVTFSSGFLLAWEQQEAQFQHSSKFISVSSASVEDRSKDTKARRQDIFIFKLYRNNNNQCSFVQCDLFILINSCIEMEITSDDEFETLDDHEGYIEVQQSAIRPAHVERPSRVFKVELVQLENLPDLIILENQYYSLNVYLNGTMVKTDIKRRFSDFDLLFEILFRKYKGYIFPAFPEKGLVSYVKTKVSLTKDHQYLLQRMRMMERFFTNLLNGGSFDMENSQEIRKFLSEREFDLFKRAQKQTSQGLIANSFNRLLSFIKMGKQNKYQSITNQLNENKKDFQKLYMCVKEIKTLLQTEEEEYKHFSDQQFAFPKSEEYYQLIKRVQENQIQNYQRIREVQFSLFCLNEDYIMVLKTIEDIEEMKTKEENYRDLEKAEQMFLSQYNKFVQMKKKQLKKISEEFSQVLKLIKSVDEAVR